jgi:predicted nucleotidyltransferase
MIRLPNDFKDFLRLLNGRRVEYLLVGGYAVGYHGYPRATVDLDIWVAATPGNARKLVEVFKEFGFDVDELKEDLFLKKNKIIRIGEPPLRIEVMTSVSGVNFDACYQKRIVETIDGTQVYFINLENLKRNKLAAGRHKDLNDLENLP